MKGRIILKIIVVFTLTMFFGTTYGQVRSQKRGISENNFTNPAELYALAPGVSWFYTWGQTPIMELEEVIEAENGVEFAPMAWNGGFSEQLLRDYFESNPKAKYLLGFNEPNFKDQANMTPAKAAALWPVLESIAADYDLELVGPALNYSPDEPYVNPAKWLDEFLEIYPEARMDYIALHCYMIQSSAQMGFINEMAERYNRKVWLTEFCAWDNLASGDAGYQTQRREMAQKIEDLELSPNVAKYAWFKAKGTNSYPFYRLLYYPTEAASGGEYGVLTELGEIYVNMSSFDPEYYHTTEKVIPATAYISSKNASLELNSDPESECKIQWENFGLGSAVSYQIDVPEAGTYALSMRMASVAKRYAPKFRFYSDNELIMEHEFTATGSMDSWETKTIPVDLPAGKQTLRLEGVQNTTCKINWLRISSDITGVDKYISLSAQVQLYREGDEFRIESESGIHSIEIINIGGQTIKSVSEQNRINVGEIRAGVYLIKIHLMDGTLITQKCVM